MRYVTLGSIVLLVAMAPRPSFAALPQQAQQFLRDNCQGCHDAEVKKGGLDLASLAKDAARPDAFARWVQVFDRVQAGEMPPKAKARPEAAAQRAFLAALNAELRDADVKRIATQGRVPARRLTRFEYERTMHDLLGIDVPLMNLLPEDPRADGFDTVSSAQQISHYQLEHYLDAADAALDAAFARALLPAPSFRLALGPAEFQKRVVRNREPKYRAKEKDLVSYSSNTAFAGRMPETQVSDSGWYRITLQAAAVNPPADGRVWCAVESGVCFAAAPTLFWIGSFEAANETREHTFEAWIQAGHILRFYPADRSLKRTPLNQKKGVDPTSTDTPGIAIKSVKIERINRGLDAAALKERLFAGLKIEKAAASQTASRKAAPVATATLTSVNPKEDIARLVRTFASRAFRRPITAAEAAPYVALAHKQLENGASLLDALRAGYRGVLASPRFLYFEEPAGRLSDHALATRLSYFLWSTMPDDELRAVADTGKLSDPKVLRAQVERMLQHPKAGAFVANFTDQWLNLADIDATTPDAKLYPEYDDVLKYAMVDETRAYFKELIASDLSVNNVVDSSFSLMNSRLARHYGIPWPGGVGMQRVALRPEHHRGGLITQGSVLKVTANGTTTSPVIRGVWMMDRIMGKQVPPVPANVPAIEPDTRGTKSIRDQLAKHRTIASCAACHAKIDPPGFALESYDVLGGWRDHYRAVKDVGKGYEKGPAVDPSYTTADGKAFKDIAEFKKILLADPDQLARNLAAKLLTYGTGAGISFADRAVLDDIVAATRKQDHGVRSLILAVVTSKSFTHK